MRVLVLIVLFLSSAASLADEAAKIQYSGFARFIGGATISSNDRAIGYSDDFKVNQHSLIGIQADYAFSEKLSATVQLLGKSENFDSGLEWLYLTYHLNENWQFKLGKLNTPFFEYSSIINVGYAYHWVLPPEEIYASFFFRKFNGIQANYSYLAEQFDLNIQTYFGYVDDEIQAGETVYTAESDVFTGFVANISSEALKFRISHTFGDYLVRETELRPFIDILNQASVINPVYANAAEKLTVDGDINFTQMSLSYNLVDFFFSSEWIKVKHDIDLLTEMESKYISLAYLVNEFTFHVTLAKKSANYDAQLPAIPTTGGLNTNLDVVIEQYEFLRQNRPDSSSKSVTLGSRWDFKDSLAFKLDIKWIEGSPTTTLPTIDSVPYDGRSTLLVGGIEWVF